MNDPREVAEEWYNMIQQVPLEKLVDQLIKVAVRSDWENITLPLISNPMLPHEYKLIFRRGLTVVMIEGYCDYTLGVIGASLYYLDSTNHFNQGVLDTADEQVLIRIANRILHGAE